MSIDIFFELVEGKNEQLDSFIQKKYLSILVLQNPVKNYGCFF